MTAILAFVTSLGCLFFSLSGVRVFSVQVFDLICVASILLCVLARPRVAIQVLARSADLGVFVLLMLAAIFAAGLYTGDLSGHLDRSLRITAQIVLVWTFVRIAMDAAELTTGRMLDLTLLSCIACALSIALQGDFNLFTTGPRQAWIRLTGLAEHPIEAGYVAAFGVLIAVDAMFRTRRYWRYLLAAAICAYSFRYSVSISAVAALGIGLVILLVLHNKLGTLFLVSIVVVIWLQYEASVGSLLFTRLSEALAQGGGYDTLASRIAQNELTLTRIDELTLLIGRGFAVSTLPYGQEVHNTLLASLYHFGVLGLAAILVLWRKLFVAALQWSRKEYRALMVAFLVIFLAISLTGPSLARRSLWFPVIIVALCQLRRPSDTIVQEAVGVRGLRHSV